MIDYAKIRGFNYQPSLGTTSLENWVYFDAHTIELELRRGKAYFPGFNTVRYWLSWDAYRRDPVKFRQNLEISLDIADKLGIKVIPCLLNRWHDSRGYDNGGIYIENILVPGCWGYYRELYAEYVADIVTMHRADPRILVWDICNEPFCYAINEYTKTLIQPELAWLTELYHLIKSIDQVTPAGVSIHGGHGWSGLVDIEPISDVLLIHPYFIATPETVFDAKKRANYIEMVKMNHDFGLKCGKPILVTETCWGAATDADRVEIIRFTLDTLTAFNFGFVAHALHYSRIADLHYPEDGFMGGPGNLAFTNKDGSIRAGHEIFNNY